MNFKGDKTVLLVDDDPQIVKIIKHLLDGEKIDLLTADSVSEANIFLDNIDVDLIIIDYILTNGSGFEIINKAKEDRPNLPIIMISGAGKDIRIASYESGVNMYVEKPFNGVELRQIILNLLSLFETQEELESANTIINALIKAVESRDSYTEGHSRRVAQMALTLYDKLGFKDQYERNNLFMGCLLHDVGKIGVPDNILNAPRELTREEYNIIKQHVVIGGKICEDLKRIEGALPIITNHHEKLDGSGYPNGLKGDEISYLVQMVTIADIYDALIFDRPYRKSIGRENSFRIMDAMVASNELNKDFLEIFKTIY